MIKDKMHRLFRKSIKQKKPLNYFRDFLWCHQESNRGHKDFQSFALPTELWHHHYVLSEQYCFSIAVAKLVGFSYSANNIKIIFAENNLNKCYMLDHQSSLLSFG